MSSNPVSQLPGHCVRILSNEELVKLQKDSVLVKQFKQEKLEREAQKNWDLFYKRNKTNFYKDRHWTSREFEDLCKSGDNIKVLEVGCGVGNFIFPLLEENQSLYFYACDFSPRAVQFVKDNPCYDLSRCNVFQCDITVDSLSHSIVSCDVDIVTMIFVLSAISPDKMTDALKNVYTVLRPGGCLLFRDYGLHDHAQLRFSPGHKLSDNFYVRQDGTRAYYFSEEVVEQIFKSVGFIVASKQYIFRETVNHKEGLSAPRVFVQGKFVKPLSEQER